MLRQATSGAILLLTGAVKYRSPKVFCKETGTSLPDTLVASLSQLLRGHAGRRRYRMAFMIAFATIHLSSAKSVGGRETVRMYVDLLVDYRKLWI